jgi:hypothetical protein
MSTTAENEPPGDAWVQVLSQRSCRRRGMLLGRRGRKTRLAVEAEHWG